MFDKLIKELKKLDGQHVSVLIEADSEGYIDRECPDEDCRYIFKVDYSDWSELFKDEAVFCPMCCKESKSDTFFTTEQIENAQNQGGAYIQGRIDKALREGAKEFNRKQAKGGFLTMSIQVKGTSPEKVIIPIPAMATLEQKLQCENCDANYAVIGSAFFCPCCGYNSVEKTLDSSLQNILDTLQNIDTIRTALSEISKDQAETTCRQLVEKGLGDCVVSFQRFCDTIYNKHSKLEGKTPKNAFQKLDLGGRLWKDLIGETYVDWINQNEYDRLNILFQRRHLLQHTEGMVDEQYLLKSKDDKYTNGQRIVVNQDDVIELVEYVKTISKAVRQKVK